MGKQHVRVPSKSGWLYWLAKIASWRKSKQRWRKLPLGKYPVLMSQQGLGSRSARQNLWTSGPTWDFSFSDCFCSCLKCLGTDKNDKQHKLMMLGLCSASVGEEMERGNGTIAAMQSLAIWHISFALSDCIRAVIRQWSSSAKAGLTLSLYL